VGLRAGLDRCDKARPHRDSISGSSSTTCINQEIKIFKNMFHLQRAIIRPKIERSPGTFNDFALYGSAQTLNVPGLRSVVGLMMAVVAEIRICCQVFNFADLIHFVLLTVIICHIITTQRDDSY